MIRRQPRSTRTDTLFPYTTLFRSGAGWKRESRAGAFSRDRRLGVGSTAHYAKWHPRNPRAAGLERLCEGIARIFLGNRFLGQEPRRAESCDLGGLGRRGGCRGSTPDDLHRDRLELRSAEPQSEL